MQAMWPSSPRFDRATKPMSRQGVASPLGSGIPRLVFRVAFLPLVSRAMLSRLAIALALPVPVSHGARPVVAFRLTIPRASSRPPILAPAAQEGPKRSVQLDSANPAESPSRRPRFAPLEGMADKRG